MKTERFMVTTRSGETIEAEISIPETIQELSKVYSMERVVKLAQDEYRKKMLKRIASKRSPRLTLRVADLSIEQREALKGFGLLKASKF